jgi:hypothetical protein
MTPSLETLIKLFKKQKYDILRKYVLNNLDIWDRATEEQKQIITLLSNFKDPSFYPQACCFRNLYLAAKLLIETNPNLTNMDHFVVFLRFSIREQNNEFAKMLLGKYPELLCEKSIKQIINVDNIPLLDWIYKNQLLKKPLLLMIEKSDKPEIIKWTYNNIPESSKVCLFKAAKFGLIDIFKQEYENNVMIHYDLTLMKNNPYCICTLRTLVNHMMHHRQIKLINWLIELSEEQNLKLNPEYLTSMVDKKTICVLTDNYVGEEAEIFDILLNYAEAEIVMEYLLAISKAGFLIGNTKELIISNIDKSPLKSHEKKRLTQAINLHHKVEKTTRSIVSSIYTPIFEVYNYFNKSSNK